MSLKLAISQATGKHTATCIFLHGLGDSSAGWSFLADQLSSMNHIKWIFPNAPNNPVTINFGMRMPSWFDIYSLGADAERPENKDREDENGILASVSSINDIITKELAENPHVPSERILVGGFSQGCVVALAVGLLTERKLAGITGLSGFLPLRRTIESKATDAGKSLPVFIGHGKVDEVVKYSWGEQTRDFLKDTLKMTDVEFHGYEGVPHSASMEELQDLKAWLAKYLPAES